MVASLHAAGLQREHGDEEGRLVCCLLWCYLDFENTVLKSALMPFLQFP